MQILILKPSFQCNNNCIMCINSQRRQSPELSLDKIKQSLTKFKNGHKDTLFLIITGGEPTINKHLIKYIELARKNGFKYIEVQTNARNLADKKYTKELTNAGANVFFISIHGHNSYTHELVTRRKGSFIETLKGIENLVNENQFVRTNTVLLKSNIKYLPSIGELISSLSIKEAQISFPHGISSFLNYYPIIVPLFSEVKPLLYETIPILLQSSVKVKVEAIPPCFLVGYEKCYMDYIEAKYPNFIYEPSYSETREEFYPFEFKRGKVYTKKCTQCDYRVACAGIYTEYLVNYEDYEFLPVKIKSQGQ
ncbi:MAG: radical SAM protein [bacterium]